MDATETVTTANAANAATEAHMSQVPQSVETVAVPETLSRETFGPASRYELQECRTRFGTIVWFVTDAEQVDDVTGGPLVIRQKDTRSEALEGFGPWCVRCDKTYDHGCNTSYCSIVCEECDLAEGKGLDEGFDLVEGFTFTTPEALAIVAERESRKGYEVGQAVEVFSFGRWYAGKVSKLGRTRIKVLYTTGSGATRDKSFSAELVRAKGAK